ncbi:MAG: hypothetical protein ACK496_02425 [Acidobacteriota bacterium]
MKLRREKFVVLAIVGWLLMGINVLADVIKLRDGSVLRGKVVSFREQRFTIVVRIGGAEARYTIPLEEIESVEFGEGAESAPTTPSAPASAAPAEPPASRKPGAEPLAGRRPPVNVGATAAGESGGGERQTTPPAPPPGGQELAGERELAGVGNTRTILIQKKITVPAAAEWISSEIRVQRGQRIVINASGEVALGDDRRTGPAGLKDLPAGLNDPRRPMPDRPTGGLIVVVGDDNDDYEFIGGSREFDAPHSGIIFLMVNERSAQDNSGSFVAQVKILSNR